MNRDASLPEPVREDAATRAVVAVVIPCYKVERQVCDVIAGIGPEVDFIYCVDDCCPNGSGKHIESHCQDQRVRVIYNERNLGVGGATIAGYRRALQDRARIIVKIDGDGQMNPALIRKFVRPIETSRADYTKGNRFFSPESVRGMPGIRLLGNAVLSFFSKLSTGYWQVIDPANGYTAIHAEVLRMLPLEKISQRYFFESDMLFRLNSVGAVLEDIPMDAVYGNEESNLRIHSIIGEFLFRHMLNFFKRIFYNYFLRDFNIASVELVAGFLMLGFGSGFGAVKWLDSLMSGVAVTAGTVMLAGLPVILGVQFLLSFLAYDMSHSASTPLHRRL
jgi:dolichol-phosphate mannosyltransferase